MFAASLAFAYAVHGDGFDPGPNPVLAQHPTVNQTSIVFTFAGDLWSIPREGGDARRLTSGRGTERDPYFSPDGQTIAFTGQYDGNVDVYTIPATGGDPKRLTAHPAADQVVGWAPDGKSVLMSSAMLSATDYPRLFTVSVSGGVPKELPLPAGVEGSFSPDGKRIAYVPNGKWQMAWKRYRGGQAAPIWLADLADSKWKPIPRGEEDLKCPMWIDDAVYYVSDPNGIMGLYRYDVKSGRRSTVVEGKGFDIKSATAGAGVIVYEKLGSIWLYDLKSKTSKPVLVSIQGDFPDVRPAFKALRPTAMSISPTGQRVVAMARGLIFTLPASKGDARQLTETVGIERKYPAWSPDGKTIAYITEEKDVQELALFDLATSTEKRLPLGEAPSVFGNPRWSPDGKTIAYTDVRLNLWVIDVANGKNTKLDTGTYRGTSDIQPIWSPDSKWITYAIDGVNHLQSIRIVEVASGKKIQVTDDLADATSPIFDRDGKHLYFMASTNVGLGHDIQDIAQLSAKGNTNSIYAVVLKKGGPNPLQPESDEEPVGPKKPPTPAVPGAPTVTIDAEGLEARTLVLPIPESSYRQLITGPAGSFFIVGEGGLIKFSFSDRKISPFAPGVFGAELSADGQKLLLQGGGQTRVVSAMAPPPPGGPGIDTSGLRAKIDPRQEWTRMFHAIWRNQKALFYAPNLHGIDADVMDKRYEPFLKNIYSRADLNYLFTDMLGELSVGHMWASGGDLGERLPTVPGGLLGCDFAIENGRYRLTHVYNGERWNPDLYAPLAQPGVEGKAGEYLLEIDGKTLDDALDIYLALEGKAGKQVRIKLGPTPDGKDARVVTIIPVASDTSLRFREWAENNRRTIAERTGGRVGYAHIPDTGGGGWTEFNRYYYAQHGKQGMIIDDRFNHGGYVADFFVREMIKTVVYGSRTRYGQDWTIPPSGVYGPKVMLANEMAGSGGDIFPHLFQLHKVGKVVGKRTWGAMISAAAFPLVDGGRINAPDDAIYDPIKGEWVIEGYGTKPDIEVELDPYLWRQGRDAQLEKAIEVILKELETAKPALQKRPDYPDKSKIGG